MVISLQRFLGGLVVRDYNGSFDLYCRYGTTLGFLQLLLQNMLAFDIPIHVYSSSLTFLKNLKNPTQILNWHTNAIQNHAFHKPPELSARFGNTLPGPSLSGAHALAKIVATLPSTCAQTSVNTIWKRVSVCNRIIPNPTP